MPGTTIAIGAIQCVVKITKIMLYLRVVLNNNYLVLLKALQSQL